MSLNKVYLIGNLGADPEVRHTQSGSTVTSFNIATTDKWTDKNGKDQEETEWHRIVVFGRQAELCGEQLRKGSGVHVEGALRTRKWTDKQNIERWSTEIVARFVHFMGAKPSNRRPEPADVGEDPRARRQGNARQDSGRRDPTPEDYGARPESADIPF